MGQPKNPDTIIIKNRYYQKGLTEGDVYKYYQNVKGRLLREVSGKDLMLLVMTDVNNPVILRKGTTTNFIRLNNSNYDNIMHGRISTVYSTMRRTEDIAIIDIDCDNFNEALQATSDTFIYAITKIPMVQEAKIYYSGKSGFHIKCQLRTKYNIDAIRKILRMVLSDSPLARNYTIEHKRTRGIPNLDLSINKFKGSYISLYSLSSLGLRCMEVEYRSLRNFTPYRGLIK